jgi:hypothetical protein
MKRLPEDGAEFEMEVRCKQDGRMVPRFESRLGWNGGVRGVKAADRK